MSARAALLVALAAACGSSQRSRMYPAGSDKDDGYGDLAQKSARWLTSTEPEASLFTPGRHRRARADGDPYGGDPYGGDPYGGALYGGDAYGGAATLPPTLRTPPGRPRRAHYNAITGLIGAIEGTVTWRGALPPPVVTACGTFDNPSVRVGPGRAAGGVLVYLENVGAGRALPSYGQPVRVGGTVAKHGCVLAPAVQIVTPLPAGLAIHGDATAARLRVTLPGGVQPFELQEAGRVLFPAQPGVTRIEADDGSLGAAWVVAADTPYYAITDDAGRFRLDELAAGTYEVTFWRPPLPGIVDGKLVYGAPAITRRSIKVEATRPARLDVALER
jgi:hypothetical protein